MTLVFFAFKEALEDISVSKLLPVKLMFNLLNHLRLAQCFKPCLFYLTQFCGQHSKQTIIIFLQQKTLNSVKLTSTVVVK
jgi:Na+/melibiose symporter-like transporter